MLNSYSASKKKGSYRRSDFDAVISNSRILNQVQQPLQTKNPYLEQKWSTMNRRPIQNYSYKANDQEKEKEKEKENVNIVQSRLDRYNCPGQSPISQPYVSPMKQSYDPKARRAIQTSRQNNKQISYQQSESKYSYKIGQQKDNTYNYNAKKYSEYKKNPPLTSRSTILYENQSRDELEKEEPYTPRQSYQKNPNLTITFSNSNNITPKKAHLQLPDELIQKCQFLKQRMQRINRMTPKGLSMRQRERQREQQITPQKYQPKKQREPMQESTSSTIVRYNKYCDQKLPLQTIYDAQQHRPEHRERQTVEQAQQGLQQISSLSKKISERLKQIINRHSN